MLIELVALGFGLTGLEITSETPGALCPPLELTEQAVEARIGEVTGGPYQARYSLMHDAEQGTASVRLVLTDAKGQMLLERYLPVPAGGCTDLAAAIAVILERYFQAISGAEPVPAPDPPPGPTPPGDPPPTPPATEPQTPPTSPSPSPSPPTSAPEPARQATDWIVARVGCGLNHEGSPLFAVGAEVDIASFVAVGADGVLALAPGHQVDRGFEFESTTHSLFVGALFTTEVNGPASLGAGPVVGLQLQEVEVLDADLTPEGYPVRFIPALGGQVALGLRATERLRFDLIGRGLWQTSTTSFAIVAEDGQKREVLAPVLGWDASLYLGASF